jgi:ferredoxin
MALLINVECTACDACKPVCPNEAITAGEPYVIDALRCTECVGAEDEAQCKLVCPVDGCIVANPDFSESREELLEKYRSLHG